MAAKPKLTIAYSVLAAGLSNVRLPEARPDVEILVIVQGHGGAVPARDDVREIRLDSLGVTRSRNAAIREARGEVLVFGEENVEWIPAGLDDLIALFDDNPRLAVFLGRAEDETGVLRKRYPAYREPATIWNSARVGTIELAVRPEMLLKAKVQFDENFGAGTDNYLGDEYILIADAAKSGLLCEFHPITVAMHPTESSGSRYRSLADARARSIIFTRVFGPLLAIPVRAVFVARDPGRFAGLGSMIRFVLGVFPAAARP